MPLCLQAQKAKNKKVQYKKWTKGFQYSKEISYRLLSDNPRFDGVFSQDSLISDQEAINMRNDFESFKWSYSAGLVYERNINDKFDIQTGLILYNSGESIVLDKINDSRVDKYLSGDLSKDRLEVNYNYLDIPVALRFKFGQHSRYDTRKTVSSYLSFNRHFIGLAGIQMGYLLNSRNSFYSSSSLSFSLRGIAGIGVTQSLGHKMYINLLLIGRHAVNPIYFEAPENLYHYSVGLSAQLLFRKEVKSKPKKVVEIIDACVLHKLKPRSPKKKKKAIYGFTYGANVSFLLGRESKKDELQYNPSLSSSNDDNNPVGIKLPLIAPRWALHIEKNYLNNRLGIFTDIGFMRRGYFARYKYENDNRETSIQTTVKENFIDIPLNIKYQVGEWAYVFAGSNISFLVKDRIKFYAQEFDYSYPSLGGYRGFATSYTISEYYQEDKMFIVWGYTGGMGFSIGDNTDLTFAVNKTSDFVRNKSLWNLSGQVSLTYLFKKRR